MNTLTINRPSKNPVASQPTDLRADRCATKPRHSSTTAVVSVRHSSARGTTTGASNLSTAARSGVFRPTLGPSILTNLRASTRSCSSAALVCAAIGLVMLGGSLSTAAARADADETTEHSALGQAPSGSYTCSMHPAVRAENPGSCPVCGMHLTRVEDETDDVGEPDGAQAPGASGDRVYTCSMHPQVSAAQPGSCPICGMRLTPVTAK